MDVRGVRAPAERGQHEVWRLAEGAAEPAVLGSEDTLHWRPAAGGPALELVVGEVVREECWRDIRGGFVTRSAIEILLLLAVVVAVVWLVVAPGPEPMVTAITALVGLLSVRLARSPDEQRMGAAAEAPGDRARVAVLPLRNITGEPGQEYLADGLTEELISVLSRVSGLQLIARASVAGYDPRDRPLAEIARELRAGSILEGSVRSAGGHIRVSVRLIEAASEVHLWSGDYDRDSREIFAVQRDIAQKVAAALEVSILQGEEARLREVPTTDLEAYDLYLLGRHDLNRRTEQGLRRSIRRFRAALEEDPSFAAAHAGIADAYVLSMIGYAGIPRDEAVREARHASERAIELQETLGDAHTSRGFVLLNFDWDWPGAEAEFRRALELNPSDARAYQWFAQCHSYQGRFQEAIPLARHAQELDPRSPLIATEAGWPLMYLGRDDEALDQFHRALDLDPDFALAHFNIGNIHELQGQLDAALERYRRALDLSGGAPMFAAFMARALARLGKEDEARAVLAEAQSDAAGALSSVYVARVHEALEEPGAALDWLERAVEDADPLVIGIRTRWLSFDRLEGMPRYEAILDRLPTAAGGVE